MKKDLSYGSSENAYKNLINSVSSSYFSYRKRNNKKERIENKKSKKNEIQSFVPKEAIKYAKEIFFENYGQLVNNSLNAFLEFIKSRKMALLKEYIYNVEIEYKVSDDIDNSVYKHFTALCISEIIQYALNKNMNGHFVAACKGFYCYGEEKRKVNISGQIYFKVADTKVKVQEKYDPSICDIVDFYNSKYKEEEYKNKKLINIAFEEYKRSKEEINRKSKSAAQVLLEKYHDDFIDTILAGFIERLENSKELPYCYDFEFDRAKSDIKQEINDSIADIDSYDARREYFLLVINELSYLVTQELKNNLPFKFYVEVRSYGYRADGLDGCLEYCINYRMGIIIERLEVFLRSL